MRVISRQPLIDNWRKPNRQDSEAPLRAWLSEAKEAVWRTPADIRARYRTASFVADNRVVFDIAGNKYRLVVHINYALQVILVKFVGTHAEYDKISVVTVGGGKKT